MNGLVSILLCLLLRTVAAMAADKPVIEAVRAHKNVPLTADPNRGASCIS
jgi:hypothetical protein